jgi:hypothetical protein
MSKARDLANAGTALTTVSATELGYLDGVTSAVQTQVDSKEATLPSQTGNSGKYLTTDGSAKSWGTVSQYALPTQTGNSGKYLTTNGTAESWGTVPTGGMTLLSTTTLSGASTTISSIDQTYTNLVVIMRGGYFNTSEAMQIRPNNVQNSGFYVGMQQTSNDQKSSIAINPFTTTSNAGNTLIMNINQYSNTTNSKPTQWFGTINQDGASTYSFAGVINTTSAITSMVFFAQGSSTFSGGTVLIYGVK